MYIYTYYIQIYIYSKLIWQHCTHATLMAFRKLNSLLDSSRTLLMRALSDLEVRVSGFEGWGASTFHPDLFSSMHTHSASSTLMQSQEADKEAKEAGSKAEEAEKAAKKLRDVGAFAHPSELRGKGWGLSFQS